MLSIQVATVELYRGAALGAPGYWAVEDTYLDKAEAAQDHGGGFTLLGGDGRTVLIRFGDLGRAVGKGMRVVSATLVLTPSGGDVPKLEGVKAVDEPWGEGPQSTLTRILANVESGGKAKPTTARGAATWNERRSGIAAWPSPGTPGGAAVAATGGPQGRDFTVAGLGPTVQGWIDRPWTNHGLALSFSGDVEFFGSQSPSGRPRLVLTTEPVPQFDLARPDLAVTQIVKEGGKWTATVRNVGAAASKGANARWWSDGKPGEAATPLAPLGPGAEATVPYGGPAPADDLQVPTLALALEPGGPDAATANDRLDVYPGGKPATLRLSPALDAATVVGYWNETVAPQSRFSFAPDGVKGRIRLEKAETTSDGARTLPEALRQIGAQLGLPTPPATGGDLYPGLMGYGDTRFEGTIPGRLTLPYEPYPNPATDTALLEPTGLLSATDVGRLNDGNDRLPLPKVVLLNALDFVGRPLPGLELTLEGPGIGTQKLTTGTTGSVVLPPIAFKNDLSNGVLTVRATQQGVTATDTIRAWRLSDAFRRSGSPAVVVEARLNLPMVPLESETDLAAGKAVTDSTGKPYAYGSALPEKPGDWIEVDLGRDRTIGEIALRPGERFWDRYEIRVYATGSKPEEAGLWAAELGSGWSRRNRSEDGLLVYRVPTQRIRFVRIVSKTGGAGTLAEVRVVPVKIATTP